MRRYPVIALLACLICAAGLAAAPAQPPRYGSADFVPTPEQPVGFCGDGNSYFPGADPPVEWWDGTPGWAKVMHRGGMGNQSPPYNDSATEAEMRVLLDRTPKNILWKVPVPGWGDSQPAIVGNRIINAYWPHLVVCYDTETGKELWRDELELCLLPSLSADGKTVGPAPDPKEARALQTLYELGHAMRHMAFTMRDFEGADPGPAEVPLARKAIERMGEWRKTLEAAYPKALPELDYDIDVAKRFVAGEYAVFGIGQAKLEDNREILKEVPQFGLNERRGLTRFAERACDTSIGNAWGSWCPLQTSSPTSDGQIVVVRFAAGQAAAYEVATGKRMWAWRDPKVRHTWTYHAPSPRIGRDVVVLDRLHGKGRAADAGPMLLGIEKRTGAIRWTAPQTTNSGYPSSTPLLVDLDDGKGGILPVVIGIGGHVFRQSDGKLLCTLDVDGTSESYTLRRGNTLFATAQSNGRHFTRMLRLEVISQDQVKAHTVRDIVEIRAAFRACTAMSDTFLFGRHGYGFDLVGMKPVAYTTPLAVGTAEARGVTIAGRYHIFPSYNFFDEKFRPRRDGMCLQTFHVLEVPRFPGSSPTPVSDQSLLGGAEAPADLFFDRHLPGFDKMRQINPRKWCGRYGTHLSAFFGTRLGGPVPKGERLYIQGQCFLYCIGPAVKGAPGDDPKVVQSIRDQADPGKLATHLAHASPQYRYEAARRLATLKAALPSDVVAQLTKLLAADIYEEIRAAALLALDACDKDGVAGWNALVSGELTPCYGTEIHYGKPGHREQQEQRRRLPLLFRAMGREAGVTMFAARWPAASSDPTQRRAILEVCIALGWKVEPVLKTAMEICQNPRAWTNDPSRRLLPSFFAAIDAASDPAVAAILVKLYPTDWTLFPTLDRHLTREEMLAWLETAGPANIASQTSVLLDAWRRIGSDALASMQRVVAKLSSDPKNAAATQHARSVKETASEIRPK